MYASRLLTWSGLSGNLHIFGESTLANMFVSNCHVHAHHINVVVMCGGGQKKRVVAELRIKQVVVGRQ